MGGNDLLFGDSGNDTLYGQDGVDKLNGGLGQDRISGGHGNDRLRGDDHSDEIWGTTGDDRIIGGSGGDVLRPGTGSNNVTGGDGSDTIIIQNSRAQNDLDRVRGNDSGDEFVFYAGSATFIEDYKAGETLEWRDGSDSKSDISISVDAARSVFFENYVFTTFDAAVLQTDAGTLVRFAGYTFGFEIDEDKGAIANVARHLAQSFDFG